MSFPCTEAPSHPGSSAPNLLFNAQIKRSGIAFPIISPFAVPGAEIEWGRKPGSPWSAFPAGRPVGCPEAAGAPVVEQPKPPAAGAAAVAASAFFGTGGDEAEL